MIDTEELKKEIKEAFKDVDFPSHCGILAAEAMDDWISDPAILRKLTKEKDFSGKWWNIPEEHISGNSLGFNYLDSAGVLYYLPAFMLLAIEKPIYKNLSTLVYELSPTVELEPDDEGLYLHFCDKFSKITGSKRNVCIKFMYFLQEKLSTVSPLDAEDVKKTIKHEYWCEHS